MNPSSLASAVQAPNTALNPERRFLLQHIGFDRTIVRAEGNYLFDEQGTCYLDALAQYGALPFGHNPSFLWDSLETLRRSAAPSFTQPLFNRASETLAKRLVGLVPGMARVVFVNSGSEAVEVAIKLARARTGRRRILTIDRGFHGTTNAALCATANERLRTPFLIDEAHFSRIPFGNVAALEAALLQKDVAALIVEPVQGEGGMRVQPPGYLQCAANLCRRAGTLLVLDEVQTGLGRTGAMFGYQHHGAIDADVLLLAKALGGGLVPLGAVLCRDDAWCEAMGRLHSSTFANSHLTTAVGCAALSEIEADDRALVHRARLRGEQLREGLEKLAAEFPTAIAAVRGQGLMHGIELCPWSGATSYFNALASSCGYAVPIVAGYLLSEHRVLMAPTFNANNVLRVQPPLTIREDEIAVILRALGAAAQAIAEEDFGRLFSAMVSPGMTVRRRRATPASDRPRPSICGGTTRRRRFAFLMHPTDDDAQFEILPAAVKELGESARIAWMRWMKSWSSKVREPGVVFHVEDLPSLTGESVEGWLIGAVPTPYDIIKMGCAERKELMSRYLEEARRVGADVVGLGAFTSVITDGGAMIADCGLHITSGNSLTAIASAESLLHHAAVKARDWSAERFAVVGAAGSVGRLVAFHLGHNGAHRLTLIGNADNRLALTRLRAAAGELLLAAIKRRAQGDDVPLARRFDPSGVAALCQRSPSCDEEYAELYEEMSRLLRAAGNEDLPVSVTTDVIAGLRDARFVVTATSAGRSFTTEDTFMQGAVVCDVARPLDVSKRVQRRADLAVFEGGLIKLPSEVRFGAQNVLGYPSGVNLACLSECIVLAMEGATRNYSIGNRIDYAEALGVFAAARRHGFTPYVDLHQAGRRAETAVQACAQKPELALLPEAASD
jgi:acetylornithine/succinyldiaminopimelate/putrescine aminotransferase/predicted amino acid dehydrogenase